VFSSLTFQCLALDQAGIVSLSEGARLVASDDPFKKAVVHLECTFRLVSEDVSITYTHVEEETLHLLG
jgi:hypothetical protein